MCVCKRERERGGVVRSQQYEKNALSEIQKHNLVCLTIKILKIIQK